MTFLQKLWKQFIEKHEFSGSLNDVISEAIRLRLLNCVGASS
jgi:hypothetical protein